MSDKKLWEQYVALEKERDALRAENEALAANLRGKHSTTGATYAHLIEDRDELRAKVDAMERQEPVGEIVAFGESLHEVSWKRGALPHLGTKLYALHGAQPAQIVPTALLVAVAVLVAQMEIVARVGFVDAPDDKDSCAAFCVAEGTWLELMSCVESLAASLAAASEAAQ